MSWAKREIKGGYGVKDFWDKSKNILYQKL